MNGSEPPVRPGPQRRPLRLRRSVGRVLEVAVVLDHHPQGQPPWGTGDRGFERAEDVGESGPLALGGHPSLEPDPLPEADLDRVLAAPALEQAQA